jgi:3-methyladenine DNA glycosylase/8-oxoguanine DNA glycosylase
MIALTVPLVGAGGEPISFRMTVGSHGLAGLPPAHVADDYSAYTYRVRLSGRVRTLRFTSENDELIVSADKALNARDRATAEAMSRRIFHLDANLAPFYAMVAADADLTWVARGAGRFLASPTAFDDVIRTICTTNCAWSATERMIEALVELGEGAFPDAETLAKTPERWFVNRAKMGYRGAYIRSIAKSVARGDVDMDSFLPAMGRNDDDVEEALRELPGVGPYAAAHIMQLLGYHRRLILDSWTRPKYLELSGKGRAKDSTIEKQFSRYKEFAGLAFWLYVTRTWHESQGNLVQSS